jgi:leader peptidase (prepilin peptidase)/N-methyltransferase
MTAILTDPTLRLVFAGVVGAIIGSFLNVVIHRLPRGESVIVGRSRCPACGRAIRPWENVPILSYLALLGRCGGCKGRISIRYPLVELSAALLFIAVAVAFESPIAWGFFFFFAAALLAVAWIDFDFRIIPDEISLGGALIGLVGSFFLPLSLVQALLGAAIGAFVLWALGAGYKRATGIEGMGGGDVKLAAMIGAFLGPTGVLFTLFVAALAGSIAGGLLMALGRAGGKTALPFGTFLAPAAVAALFFAPAFFSWYTQTFLVV